MNYKKAIENLQAAELELRKQIATGNSAVDYDDFYDCLNYAQQINELIAVLKAGKTTPSKAKTASKAQKKTETQTPKKENTPAPKADELPTYFLFNDKLWKVATRGKDSDSLYHKSVPKEDVEIVTEAISKAFKKPGSATISSIENNLRPSLPTYKTQITVMALVKAGVLKSAGRGKYSPASDSPITQPDLMDALENMAVHTDLLKKAGANL